MTPKTPSGVTARTGLKAPLMPKLTRRILCGAAALVAAASCAAPSAQADFGGTPVLTRVYAGNDHSALYAREVAGKVVGFGEHPGTHVAFAFEGTRSGATITAKYWDLPKGNHTGAGSLKLSVADGGATLTRTSATDIGPDSWHAVDEDTVAWPKGREAMFQSLSANDLDGAFSGSDGSRAYVRQTTTDVVFVAENFVTEAYSRPAYATLVVAKRNENGFVSGHFYDLPKGGQALHHGSFLGQAGSSPRTLSQSLYAYDLSKTLSRASLFSADYAVDIAKFAQELEERGGPTVVGFGYAIAAGKKVVAEGAVGSRRLADAVNGVTQAPYTPYTTNEIASTSKVVTMAAVLRALRQYGISLDSPVDPYLPAQWPRGASMKTVTFRDLLTHGRTLKPAPAGLFKPGNCATEFYACLQGAVANGMTVGAGYDNIHYTIFRVILPFITHRTQMQQLFATETDTVKINEQFSAAFRDDIRKFLLSATVDADFAYPADSDLAYRYLWGTPPTLVTAPVGSESDYLAAGSGGLKMNAVEYANFLWRLDNGWLVMPEDLAEMKKMQFGADVTLNGSAGVGPLYGKQGGAPGTGSYAMIFPGDVQVFITYNSTVNGAPQNDGPTVRAAWSAALV